MAYFWYVLPSLPPTQTPSIQQLIQTTLSSSPTHPPTHPHPNSPAHEGPSPYVGDEKLDALLKAFLEGDDEFRNQR